MVVKEDGTKWACQSCLKGHRVSGCTHTDRELTLVPKKGRPVTQCHHCRQERKKRSAHVSCDCAQPEKPNHPKEKCIHLREAEEKAKAAGYHDDGSEKDPAHLARIAEEQGCCCGHGGKCTCALLMKGADNGAAKPRGPAVKPKLEKTSSEGAITVFQNGHHKPVHRKNHAAHETGMPYKVPRLNTAQSVPSAATRSVDSLALNPNASWQPSPYLPQTNAPLYTPRRRSKSEEAVPRVPFSFGSAPCSGLSDAKFTNMDFSGLTQFPSNQSMQSTPSETYSFPSADPLSAVADSSYDPWSAYPSAESQSMPNNNPFGVWPTHNDNFSMSHPALSASSSGTTSDFDEMQQPMNDPYEFDMSSFQEHTGFNPASVPSSNSPQSNRHSLPPGFFGNMNMSMAGMGNEWQAPHNFSQASEPTVAQEQHPSHFDGTWQSSAAVRPINVPQRVLGGLSPSARKQSHSLGHVNAPDDDIIKQLFPEIDVDAGMHVPTSSPPMDNGTAHSAGPTSAPGSAPTDYPPMEQKFGASHMGGMPASAPRSAPMEFNSGDHNVEPHHMGGMPTSAPTSAPSFSPEEQNVATHHMGAMPTSAPTSAPMEFNSADQNPGNHHMGRMPTSDPTSAPSFDPGDQNVGAHHVGGMPTSDTTSAQLHFGPSNHELGFTSQPWSDGSMGMSNDVFTQPYELDQDFSNPNFTPNWSQ
ncbi:hypothetical protein LTR37_011509 [Vermiconidia calcicola]|uniref:Uncharacterized protein n=1 Tax=Vermiconidia calcicola TaxID=1690605 RepID=A0ACC3N1S7_9PEZI|nr:hypothetical protein LTR37_011509 [Vermiconidia calcicola]